MAVFPPETTINRRPRAENSRFEKGYGNAGGSQEQDCRAEEHGDQSAFALSLDAVFSLIARAGSIYRCRPSSWRRFQHQRRRAGRSVQSERTLPGDDVVHGAKSSGRNKRPSLADRRGAARVRWPRLVRLADDQPGIFRPRRHRQGSRQAFTDIRAIGEGHANAPETWATERRHCLMGRHTPSAA